MPVYSSYSSYQNGEPPRSRRLSDSSVHSTRSFSSMDLRPLSEDGFDDAPPPPGLGSVITNGPNSQGATERPKQVTPKSSFIEVAPTHPPSGLDGGYESTEGYRRMAYPKARKSNAAILPHLYEKTGPEPESPEVERHSEGHLESVSPAEKPKRNRTVVLVAMVVLLMAVAGILGGVLGSRANRCPAPAPAVSSPGNNQTAGAAGDLNASGLGSNDTNHVPPMDPFNHTNHTLSADFADVSPSPSHVMQSGIDGSVEPSGFTHATQTPNTWSAEPAVSSAGDG